VSDDRKRGERLVPWLPTEALDEEERRDAEAFAGEDGEGAELRALAEAIDREAREYGLDHLLEEPHPELLRRWVADPQSLAEDARRIVERSLGSSEETRALVAILREVQRELERGEVSAAEARPPVSREFWRRIWEGLAGTVLAPAPALAYLVLLAIALPLFVGRQGDEAAAPPAARVARVRTLEGEVSLRGPARRAPLTVEAARGAMLLELALDLEPAMRAPDARFEARLLAEGKTLWKTARPPDDLGEDDTLALLLEPEGLEEGEVYRLEVRFRRSLDPLDGEPVFSRQVELRRRD
jgi:hypothetical protein